MNVMERCRELEQEYIKRSQELVKNRVIVKHIKQFRKNPRMNPFKQNYMFE